MIDLLSGRPAQLLAETLLHFLWQGAAVALLLLLIDPLLRTVGNKYAASLSALLLMLALPVATYYLAAQRESAPTLSRATHLDAFAPLTFEPDQIAIPPTTLSHWQPLFVGLWLLGVLSLAARLLVGYIATLWLRGDRRPLPAKLAQKVAWLGQRLGVTTRCRVFLSTRITEAIAVGCFKPLVLIPLAWASELPPSALEAVIAHELAHIRRWDLWATLLQRLVETLLFYHPAVWWLSRRLSQQRELCCDALAVSATCSPADYVLALETIARRTSAPPLTLATAFLGGGKMNLLDRVRHVLAGSPREASAWWPAGLAALAAPLLVTAAVGGWSLLPSAVVADEERETPQEERADEETEGTAELIEAALEILATNFQEDGDNAEESEEAALKRKLDAARERKAEQELRAAKEALARETKKAEKSNKEEVAKKKNPRKSDDDFDLSDFKPETEREAQLLAVIKKLQSQVKKNGLDGFEKFKMGSGSSKKKNPPESKGPEAYYELKKVFGEKLKQDDAEYKRALGERDLAIAKEREAKELAAREYKRAAAAKEALLAKEREAKERAIKEEKYKQDLDAVDKEAYLRALKEKDAIREKQALARKQQEAAAAAEKDAYYRSFKDGKPSAEGKVKWASDEVETLRQALREREAEVKKLHQALEQVRKVAPDKGEFRKDPTKRKDPDRKDGDRKEGEKGDPDRKDKDGKEISDLNKSFDDYVRLRLDGIEFVRQESEADRQ